MKHFSFIGLAAGLLACAGAQAVSAGGPRLEGMALKPAGDATPNRGHHHLIIDGGPAPKGAVIESSETSRHFGKGETETQLTLPPGKHKLTLQFGDGSHVSYGPGLSSTITVDVKS